MDGFNYLKKAKEYNNKFRELMNKPDSKMQCIEILNVSLDFILKDHILLMDFLSEVSWAFDYLEENLSRFLANSFYKSINIYTIIKCGIRQNKQNILEQLAYSEDLNIRAEFMKVIFEEYRNKIRKFYPNNICSYFSIIKEDGKEILMAEKDVSAIACNLFDCVFDEELYSQIKEFIFAIYNSNHLADYIGDILKKDDYKPAIFHHYEELMKDINRYFETSVNYKYELLKHFGDKITSPSKEKYLFAYNAIFKDLKCDINGQIMILGAHLHQLRDKYLELIYKYYQESESKEIKYKGSGSTAFSIQIGDRLLKFTDGKYAKYEIPEIFLIVKNFEYYEIRDKSDNIIGTIEIQPCLSKPFEKDNDEMEMLFRYELEKLGYYLEDDLISKDRVNCFYLDDYHDANCDDPEALPDWFKERPLVLVDRDLVIPLEEKEIFEETIKKKRRNI